MAITTVSVTYLGVLLCYAASTRSSASSNAAARRALGGPRVLRGAGGALLGLGVVLAAAVWPLGEALLVWLSAAMLAASVTVIAAPLLGRFVPASGALAGIAAVLAPWLSAS